MRVCIFKEHILKSLFFERQYPQVYLPSFQQGEKECTFYIRKGSCGYGPSCRFHHPNPTGVGGHDPNSSPPNDECSGQFSVTAAHDNGEFIPLNASGASHPAQASWPTHVLCDKAVPYYQENHSAYTPMMHFLPQEALPTPEWNGYQVSSVQF